MRVVKDYLAERVNGKRRFNGKKQRRQKEEDNPHGQPQITSGHLGVYCFRLLVDVFLSSRRALLIGRCQ
jgi:hypothetical protein